ncbi:MAG: PH domain-containing protein [Actinobacteria bacterium]|nr:PH domain-containing protein [Actinomycetota bacterium]
MAFPSRLLHDGEELIVDVRLHWSHFAGPAGGLAAMLALLVTLSVGSAPELLQLLAAMATLVALARFVVRYARWASTHVVLTDRRVVHRHGVVAKEGVEIPLDHVHAVSYRRPLMGRLLRYGDLVVRSGGRHGEVLHRIPRISRPMWVQCQITEQLGRARQPRV